MLSLSATRDEHQPLNPSEQEQPGGLNGAPIKHKHGRKWKKASVHAACSMEGN